VFLRNRRTVIRCNAAGGWGRWCKGAPQATGATGATGAPSGERRCGGAAPWVWPEQELGGPGGSRHGKQVRSPAFPVGLIAGSLPLATYAAAYAATDDGGLGEIRPIRGGAFGAPQLGEVSAVG
jgi:hypothetical protein